MPDRLAKLDDLYSVGIDLLTLCGGTPKTVGNTEIDAEHLVWIERYDLRLRLINEQDKPFRLVCMFLNLDHAFLVLPAHQTVQDRQKRLVLFFCIELHRITGFPLMFL